MIDFTKRYWVFSFSDYYPSGGLSDVRGTYDTVNDAKKAVIDGSIFISSDTTYIFDKITGETYDDFSTDPHI